MLNQETVTIRAAGQTVEVRVYGRDPYWVEKLIRACESAVSDGASRVNRDYMETVQLEMPRPWPASGCQGCPD